MISRASIHLELVTRPITSAAHKHLHLSAGTRQGKGNRLGTCEQ